VLISVSRASASRDSWRHFPNRSEPSRIPAWAISARPSRIAGRLRRKLRYLRKSGTSPGLGIAQRAPELNDSLTVKRNR
jgi:hypothetical protein